jgi:D-amino-acid oxidase
VWAGLRPSRTPLRLGSEIKKRGSALNDVLVCHCYGHGGSGVTLSWGCAEDIVLNHILPFLPLIIEKSKSDM